MRVSVIVPAYNEENYLASCLRSLKGQDYTGDWEIIVVDNASTDSTAQIARSFGVKVVRCARKGVVFARQAGVDAAQGDIIVQADADAVFPPGWLFGIVHRLTENPKAVAVAGDVRYIRAPAWGNLLSFLGLGANRLWYRFCGHPARIFASNVAYWKSAFVRAGRFNTALPGIGDEQDFLARLAKIGKVVYDGSITVFVSSRRLHGRFLQFVFIDVLYYNLTANVLYSLTGKSVGSDRLDIRLVEGTLRLQPRWVFAVLLPVLLAAVAVSAYAYFSPRSQVFGKVYSREPSTGAGGKLIALSFDDGPNEPYTSQALAILKRYNVKATFFVVGKNVEYYPDAARQIVAEGHILGNHTYDHRVSTALVEWQSQLNMAQDSIIRITGVKPRLFRPPFGQKTPWELEDIQSRGFVTVAWSISANDPNAPSSGTIAQRIISKAHPGGIILLHDGKETKHGWNRSRTMDALPTIIETLQARGYTFVTIPELLDIPGYFE